MVHYFGGAYGGRRYGRRGGYYTPRSYTPVYVVTQPAQDKDDDDDAGMVLSSSTMQWLLIFLVVIVLAGLALWWLKAAGRL